MIKIENGRVFVDGKETIDPLLIGYAVLDAAEDNKISINTEAEIDDAIKKVFDASFKAGETFGKICLDLTRK
jgi:hypothetical protein